MKVLKLIFALLVFGSGTVLAQTPAAAPVDSEQRAAVKELLDAMNFKQVMSQMGTMMVQQMPKMLDQMIDHFPGSAQMSAEQKTEARALAQKAQTNSSKRFTEMYNDPQFIQEFEDIMARAYAKHFTTAEIKTTTAFYTSPVGKKALTIMPQMMQETMPEIMTMMAPRMNALMESMAKDVLAQVEKKNKAEAAAATK